MAASVDLRVAIIGATAAVLGTLAGGGVTWWQTRDLQDRQFEREDHIRVVTAGAAAAVEANRYGMARSAVDAMLASRYYAELGESLEPRLGIADSQLLVGQLNPQQLAARNKADVCLVDLTNAVRGHTAGPDRIPEELEPFLKRISVCAADGVSAMAPVAKKARSG